MVFKNTRNGRGYDVNMGGTNFQITFYPVNTREQTIYFNSCNHCTPGTIKLVEGSLQTSPCDYTADVSEEANQDCQDLMHYTTDITSGGKRIKFQNASPGLGAGGRQQTDTYTVQVDNGGSEVRIKTNAGTSGMWTTLDGVGDSEVNTVGFLLAIDDITDDVYTLSVTSESNADPLDYVIFDFGNGSDVRYPENNQDIDIYRNGDCNDGSTNYYTGNNSEDDGGKGYYDHHGNWHHWGHGGQGYYDQDSNWHSGDGGDGCYDSEGDWHHWNGGNHGYYDHYGNWHNSEHGGKDSGEDSGCTPNGAGKITICHYPPGNPENAHTITIDESAWPAHQAHGDVCGPCSSGEQEVEHDTSIYNIDFQLINPYPADVPVYVNAVKVTWWNLPDQSVDNDGGKGYYDHHGHWHHWGHNGEGYYDQNCNWHSGSGGGGYYDHHGSWHNYSGGNHGWYDHHGYWHGQGDDGKGKGKDYGDNDDEPGMGDHLDDSGNCVDGDGDGKITICHYPPGNPENAHDITISENAWPAHQAHGDECGPCAQQGGSAINTDAYLEEFAIDGRTLWNDPDNRMPSGTTINIPMDSLLIFYPQVITPDDYMYNFYTDVSGGSPRDMGSAFVEMTFYGVDGTPYPVRFQVPTCPYAGQDQSGYDHDDNDGKGDYDDGKDGKDGKNNGKGGYDHGHNW